MSITSKFDASNKTKKIFHTPAKENTVSIGLLVMRLSIAFSFVWAGFNKMADPAGFGNMLHDLVGIDLVIAPTLSLAIGLFEIISSGLILVGLFTRISAVFQIMILSGALAMFGLDFSAGPGIWKDIALIGVTAMLVLAGSGKFGIDYLITKHYTRVHGSAV